MAACTSSLVHPKYKTKYSVKNWPEYEQGRYCHVNSTHGTMPG